MSGPKESNEEKMMELIGPGLVFIALIISSYKHQKTVTACLSVFLIVMFALLNL